MTNHVSTEVALADRTWLRQLAGQLCRDPDLAEDLVQETLVEAWRTPPLDDGRPLRPWLAGVLRNRERLHRRGAGRRQRREQRSASQPPATSPEAQRAQNERLEILVAELQRLPAIDQEILVRRFFADENATEIGRDLKMSAITVRSRCRRALASLRSSLQRKYDGRSTAEHLTLTPSAAASLSSPSAASRGANMSLTAKILGLCAVGTIGGAGAWYYGASPEAPTAVSVATPVAEASAPLPANGPRPAAPRTRDDLRRRAFEQRVAKIRGTFQTQPPAPPPKRPALLEDSYKDLVWDCLSDLGYQHTSVGFTLRVEEIGAPDIGTIYSDVEMVRTDIDDPEVRKCLVEATYDYVGAAPETGFQRVFEISSVFVPPGGSDAEPTQADKQSVFERIVEAHMPEVRYCATLGESRGGRIVMSLTVDRPVNIVMTLTELPNRALNEDGAVVQCISERGRRWKFPNSLNGETFSYRFPSPL